MAKKSSDLKKSQKTKDGLLETLFYRKISMNITKLLIKTNITPNQVTFLSLVFALIAAVFFFLSYYGYKYLVIGAIFTQIALLFDYVDGEIARYKNLTSKFGGWFDCIADRIKYISMISALSISLYLKTANPIVLILGMFSILNLLMMNIVRLAARHYIKPKFYYAVSIKKTYISEVATISGIITIGALLNQVYYTLLIFATLGVLVWLKQMFDVFKRERKVK